MSFKKILQHILICGTFLVSGSLVLNSDKAFEKCDVIDFKEDILENDSKTLSLTGKGAVQVGVAQTSDYCSPVYFSYFQSNTDGKFLVRYYAAISGSIDTVSFTRTFTNPEDSSSVTKTITLNEVYESIKDQSGNTIYYNGSTTTTDSAYKHKYYWAVYSLKFESTTYVRHDTKVTVTIDNVDKQTSDSQNLYNLVVDTKTNAAYELVEKQGLEGWWVNDVNFELSINNPVLSSDPLNADYMFIDAATSSSTLRLRIIGFGKWTYSSGEVIKVLVHPTDYSASISNSTNWTIKSTDYSYLLYEPTPNDGVNRTGTKRKAGLTNYFSHTKVADGGDEVNGCLYYEYYDDTHGDFFYLDFSVSYSDLGLTSPSTSRIAISITEHYNGNTAASTTTAVRQTEMYTCDDEDAMMTYQKQKLGTLSNQANYFVARMKGGLDVINYRSDTSESKSNTLTLEKDGYQCDVNFMRNSLGVYLRVEQHLLTVKAGTNGNWWDIDNFELRIGTFSNPSCERGAESLKQFYMNWKKAYNSTYMKDIFTTHPTYDKTTGYFELTMETFIPNPFGHTSTSLMPVAFGFNSDASWKAASWSYTSSGEANAVPNNYRYITTYGLLPFTDSRIKKSGFASTDLYNSATPLNRGSTTTATDTDTDVFKMYLKTSSDFNFTIKFNNYGAGTANDSNYLFKFDGVNTDGTSAGYAICRADWWCESKSTFAVTYTSYNLAWGDNYMAYTKDMTVTAVLSYSLTNKKISVSCTYATNVATASTMSFTYEIANVSSSLRALGFNLGYRYAGVSVTSLVLNSGTLYA